MTALCTSTSIPLSNLPLRPSTLEVLQQRGFTNTSEVARSRRDGGLANLAAELGCSLRQATDYFRELQGCLTMTTSSHSQRMGQGDINRISSSANGMIKAQTASQILNITSNNNNSNNPRNNRSRNLVTFSRSIDNLLGGGIGIGEVTEIAGNPGCGKTQLAMQLSVDARLPTEYGGAAGETVYLDTEGNFCPERCYTMAHSLVDHVRKSAERKRRNMNNANHRMMLPPQVPEWFEPDTIMKGIHVYRAHDEAAQTAIITALPNFLRRREQLGCPVKLLVVDSIAFHYRCAPPGGNYMARTRSLSTVASLLSDIATSFDLAVAVINQMTTKFGSSGTECRLVPALGESWAHATTTRLVLNSSSQSHHRTCNLVKSPHKPCGIATYKVLECGIRDVDTRDVSSRALSRDPSSSSTASNNHQHQHQHSMDPSKRQRTH